VAAGAARPADGLLGRTRDAARVVQRLRARRRPGGPARHDDLAVPVAGLLPLRADREPGAGVGRRAAARQSALAPLRALARRPRLRARRPVPAPLAARVRRHFARRVRARPRPLPPLEGPVRGRGVSAWPPLPTSP